MAITEQLIPELSLWNAGKGISASDWIYGEGRADHALGFCSMFWPDVGVFEQYVLRGPINVGHLRGWELGGHSRSEIETAMNAYFLEDIFPHDTVPSKLKKEQVSYLARIMVEMLSAKLRTAFADRQFSVFVIDDGDDYAVSFHQA